VLRGRRQHGASRPQATCKRSLGLVERAEFADFIACDARIICNLRGAATALPRVSGTILDLSGAASSSHEDDAMIRRARMTIASLSKRIDSRFRRAEKRTAARFDAVDARFEAVDARFDGVDRRLDAMGAALARADRKIDSLDEKLDWIAGFLKQNLEHQKQINNEYNDRLNDLERAARQ
jgi:hypothetical protein